MQALYVEHIKNEKKKKKKIQHKTNRGPRLI